MSKRNTEFTQWVNAKVNEITSAAEADAEDSFGGPPVGATEIVTNKFGFVDDGIQYNFTITTEDHGMFCTKVFPFIAVWKKEVDNATYYIRAEMGSTKDNIFDIGATLIDTHVERSEALPLLHEVFGTALVKAAENQTGTVQQAWEFANLNGFIELNYLDALDDTTEWMNDRVDARLNA